MNKYAKEISLLGVLTALYVALCVVSWPLAYGPFQFRIAEVLIVLPFYNKKYSIAVILGTFIANLIGPFGIVDAVVGSAASAIVCLIIITAKNKLAIAPAAAVINGLIIGAMIYILDAVGDPLAGIAIAGSVAFGVFAVVLAGVLAFTGLERTNPRIIVMIKDMKIAKNESQKV